jgi:hypothetical protein
MSLTMVVNCMFGTITVGKCCVVVSVFRGFL